MVYKALKPRPRIKTQVGNGSGIPNYKNGWLRSVKSAQRLHSGRNDNRMYASQPSPENGTKQKVQSLLWNYF